MKGILKKTTAVLKVALAVLPYTVLTGGIFTLVVSGIAGSVAQDKAEKEFKSSQVFIERQAEDLEYLEGLYNSGEITEGQFNEQKDSLHDDKYVDALLELPQFYDQKEMIKNSTKSFNIAATVGGVSLVLAFIPTGIYLKTDIAEDLIYSAKKDWKKSKKGNEGIEIEI